MRGIKFRIYDKEKETYLISYAARGVVDLTWVLIYMKVETTERFVIEQYTGLNDKHGNEIYEGDLITFSTNDTVELGDIDILVWKDQEVFYSYGSASFLFGREHEFGMIDRIMPNTMEVTGNIHKNHESHT